MMNHGEFASWLDNGHSSTIFSYSCILLIIITRFVCCSWVTCWCRHGIFTSFCALKFLMCSQANLDMNVRILDLIMWFYVLCFHFNQFITWHAMLSKAWLYSQLILLWSMLACWNCQWVVHYMVGLRYGLQSSFDIALWCVQIVQLD